MANPALEAALKAVLAELQKADGAALKGGGGMKVEIEAEPGAEPMGEECPACAAGECTNPDHMDDSALTSMMEG